MGLVVKMPPIEQATPWSGRSEVNFEARVQVC
jgi:hypothetical protein